MGILEALHGFIGKERKISLVEKISIYSRATRQHVLEALVEEARKRNASVYISAEEILLIMKSGATARPETVEPSLLAEPILYQTDIKRDFFPENISSITSEGDCYTIEP
ncbi:hypothetical protein KY311_04120 [Candidatus Woesearchaeota archaeon]|nr:hypothetical protein [Candidatus Woesearchaeota archaeon]MBW3016895.1 hypothetical protein [Candidatus Woesearchaeota archaeon]